ncbi:hypothetical protein ACWD3J_38925 [Streptomyces sp. NPDC002755]|uniref:hypothetical protein n=1 Tax=Streptomyces sp. NPDC002884 TaxID=3154544 RepID=UPI00331EA89D
MNKPPTTCAPCTAAPPPPRAARHITAFDTARDPDGTLTFACLLYLADQEEGAQFWWHYAAGAGSTTAALSLYLLHVRQGDTPLRESPAGLAWTATPRSRRCGPHRNPRPIPN